MKLINLLAGAAIAAACAAGAQAGTYIVGAGANSGNCFPFGCTRIGSGYASTLYQQVYASSDFGGPLSITGLTFYDSNFPSSPLNSGTYTISLSTTSAQVDNLNTTNFAQNIGADNAVLFSGALPSLTPGGSFTLPFTGAFNYNPSNGNLLVNVDISGPVDGNAYLNSYAGDANGIFSRADNFGSAFYTGYGLETGFVTLAGGVPEPATWAMMLVGLGGLGVAMRSRRRRVAATI